MSALILGFFLFVVDTTFAGDANHLLPEKARLNCRATTKFATTVGGGRCRFRDEVVIGVVSVDPIIVRCARLDVQCSRDPSSSKTEN